MHKALEPTPLTQRTIKTLEDGPTWWEEGVLGPQLSTDFRAFALQCDTCEQCKSKIHGILVLIKNATLECFLALWPEFKILGLAEWLNWKKTCIRNIRP
jgi:hypothetical protein